MRVWYHSKVSEARLQSVVPCRSYDRIYLLIRHLYRKRDFQQNISFSLGENVVLLDLCNIYKNNQKLIAFDNFFTSFLLPKTLNERGLLSVVKGLPDTLKTKDRLDRGEFMFCTKSCVVAIKWQDNKPVTLLSYYITLKKQPNVCKTEK